MYKKICWKIGYLLDVKGSCLQFHTSFKAEYNISGETISQVKLVSLISRMTRY